MKAPLLVDALRARDPGAPGALYDTHGASLFRYCWFLLGNRDAAQVALRVTLVVAEAHISRLRTPALLRAWLFALARAECRRRQSPGAPHDAVIARPDQPDADRRLIAWHAVMSLNALEREALDLTITHGMDVAPAALVLGLSPNETQTLLDRAREHLQQALAGEILARHGVHGCPERVAALQGWAGELTVALRERLVSHATSCQACARYLPRSVSASKVFELLPVPVAPQAMRLRVMTCFSDPELVGYRMFVAARVEGFDDLGFPDPDAAAAPAPRRISAKVWSGPAAAAVAVAVLIATVFAVSRLGGFATPVQGVSSASGTQATVTAPSAAGPDTSPAGSPGPAGSADASRSPHEAAVSPARGPVTRLYLRGTPVPYRSSGSGPTGPVTGPSPGRLDVSPDQLSLGTGATGEITLQAVGGPVTWSAGESSPDITLSSSGGTLAAGQQATVTVDVTRSHAVAGQGTITITIGGGSGAGAAVTVTWSDPASSSPPPPPPSISPTPTVITSSPAWSPPRMRVPTPTPSPSPATGSARGSSPAS